MEPNLILALTLFICIYLLFIVVKLNSRIKKLENTLKQISNQIDIPESINDELLQLIEEGKDVKAVKRARELLGLSLIDAKLYIDTLKLEAK